MSKTIYNFQYREEENGQTLMNNAVFGKTTENLRKRLIVQLVNNQSKARKLTSKPSFHASRIFNEDLVAVHMLKQCLYLNIPIYVGFSILDLSKTLMYDFHYNYMKTKYGPSTQLLFTDTDSLCYSVIPSTQDVYQDMMKDNIFSTHRIMTQNIHYIVQKIRKSWGK